MNFNQLYNIILEYFVQNAKAYYITNDSKLHPVEYTHIQQIIDDFNLEDEIRDDFTGLYDTVFDWDEDGEFVIDFMKDYKQSHNIHFIVVDLSERILHVRAKENLLNKKQKQTIMKYCIKHGCEMNYDSMALA